MNGLDQNSLALAVVATAGAYILSRAVSQFWRRPRGCEVGCATCPVENPNESSPSTVISEQQLNESANQLRQGVKRK